jgi:hypothetical protein
MTGKSTILPTPIMKSDLAFSTVLELDLLFVERPLFKLPNNLFFKGFTVIRSGGETGL